MLKQWLEVELNRYTHTVNVRIINADSTRQQLVDEANATSRCDDDVRLRGCVYVSNWCLRVRVSARVAMRMTFVQMRARGCESAGVLVSAKAYTGVCECVCAHAHVCVCVVCGCVRARARAGDRVLQSPERGGRRWLRNPCMYM